MPPLGAPAAEPVGSLPGETRSADIETTAEPLTFAEILRAAR